VVHFLRRDAGFQDAWSKYGNRISVEHWLTGPQVMQPVAAAASWAIPAIETAGALAEWLTAGHGELQWHADLKGLGYRKNGTRLRHYHYRPSPHNTAAFASSKRPPGRCSSGRS
jgi:hypothetical protein